MHILESSNKYVEEAQSSALPPPGINRDNRKLSEYK